MQTQTSTDTGVDHEVMVINQIATKLKQLTDAPEIGLTSWHSAVTRMMNHLKNIQDGIYDFSRSPT